MGKSWDSYLKQQLKKPQVRASFEQEKRMLQLGIMLTRQRESKRLTQADVALRIGTSAPQVSRTESRPERANMQTLMRYADALGLQLDVKLVSKRRPRSKKFSAAAEP